MCHVRSGASEVGERYERLVAVQGLLAHVARNIGPAVELEPVLRIALEAMRSLVRFRGGTICLVDEEGVYVAAADPAVTEDVARARVPVGTGLAGRVVSTGAAVYSPDVTTDERVDARLRSLGSNAPMRSYLAVPLVCLGDVIGLLQIDSSDVDAFDEEDRAVLDGLATQVAGAIESARRWEAVQRLDDARAMFVARVSHELRTPLTIMVGLADTLSLQRDRFELGAEAADVVDRIRAAGARLRVLIDELVMVGTVESGVLLQPEPVAFAVGALLERAALESSDPAVVSVECPDGLHATADPRFVAQVLHLLVENAIAYAGAATLTASTSAGVVRLAVIDHGPGIPDDRKQAVFERFVRGDHGGSGWGLGLSVAARLAEAMGAPLDVRDTPGGGATFTLELR